MYIFIWAISFFPMMLDRRVVFMYCIHLVNTSITQQSQCLDTLLVSHSLTTKYIFVFKMSWSWDVIYCNRQNIPNILHTPWLKFESRSGYCEIFIYCVSLKVCEMVPMEKNWVNCTYRVTDKGNNSAGISSAETPLKLTGSVQKYQRWEIYQWLFLLVTETVSLNAGSLGQPTTFMLCLWFLKHPDCG